MRVVADPVNLLVAIHDGASVSRTNPGNASAGALSADLPFGVLFRVGIVLRRVFKKLSFGLVMPFSVFVSFGISFATLKCWWRSSQMAFHTRVSTFVVAVHVVLGSIDPVCLHVLD